jgi:hypothetical protein
MRDARQTFVSSIPYDRQRIRAAAIYCSDGRFGDHVDDFLHNALGLPRYDRMALPGGPACLSGRLADYWDAHSVEEQLRFLGQVHDVRRVVLIAHAECAYYARRLGIAPDAIAAEQNKDLHQAQLTVRRVLPGVEVSLCLARIVGDQVSFESL